MNRIRCLSASAGLAAALACQTAAAATVSVSQADRQFKPAELTIAAGDAVKIDNRDQFIHQIYVDSPQLHFDSDEQPPGQTIEITFPKAGDFRVRCHIHPKMLLVIHVR